MAEVSESAVVKTVLLGCYVPPDLKKRFEKVAHENERTVSAQLRVALREWLVENES
jgi:predicted transcriptional regulator